MPTEAEQYDISEAIGDDLHGMLEDGVDLEVAMKRATERLRSTREQE